MRKVTGILLFTLMTCSYAGHNGLTHGAIANCPTHDITESVSWDKTKAHWLRVWGHHQGPRGEYAHEVYNRSWNEKYGGGWEYTWRCNATCLGDRTNYNYYSFSVNTLHHIRSETGKAIVAHYGEFYNCNAYDGWWDT